MLFSSKYCNTTPSVIGRIHRCTTTDTESPGWGGPTIRYTRILHCAEGWRPKPHVVQRSTALPIGSVSQKNPGLHTLHGGRVLISTFHEGTEYSLEGLMLKLKLQSFGHLRRRADSLEKTLMLGEIEQEKGMTEDEMVVGWHH